MKLKYTMALAVMALATASMHGADVNVAAPGDLAAGTVSTDPSATSLRITGTLDASDLLYVARNFSNLLSLDLSGVTIAEYQGQQLDGRVNYPANTIPAMCFAGSPLTSVTFPTAGVTIGDFAFTSSALTSVTLPMTVTGEYAFADCKALTTADVAATGQLADGVFDGCTALAAVNGSRSVTRIGNAAFAGCSALTNFAFSNNLVAVGDQAFERSGLVDADFTNARNLGKVGARAFSDCLEITAVSFNPNGRVELGQSAMFNCPKLEAVALSGNMTTLPDYVLTNALSLTGHLDVPHSVTKIGDNALTRVSGLNELTLPESLDSIADGAMRQMTGLTKIHAAGLQQVPVLGNEVFEGINQPNVILEVNNNTAYLFRTTPQWQEFNIQDNTGVADDIVDTDHTLQGRFVGTELQIESSGIEITGLRLHNVAGMLLAELNVAPTTALACDTAQFDARIYLVTVTLADGRNATLKLAR